jgi:hypothetical protein
MIYGNSQIICIIDNIHVVGKMLLFGGCVHYLDRLQIFQLGASSFKGGLLFMLLILTLVLDCCRERDYKYINLCNFVNVKVKIIGK